MNENCANAGERVQCCYYKFYWAGERAVATPPFAKGTVGVCCSTPGTWSNYSSLCRFTGGNLALTMASTSARYCHKNHYSIQTGITNFWCFSFPETQLVSQKR